MLIRLHTIGPHCHLVATAKTISLSYKTKPQRHLVAECSYSTRGGNVFTGN
jgi:hypothetical protein